jgi:dolichyl-phosphate beta-glucosyltransferase
LNIFSTTWLWPPHGVNLLDNASSPLVGIVLAPITWVFGPFVATTLALTVAPGLSAWGCWLACRRFVSWAPACVLGGLLFGYSPFVVQDVAQGHLGLGLLLVPPLMLLVLHEIFVRRQRSATWCGVTLGLLIAVQFLISQEILSLTVLTAAAGIVLAIVLAPRRAWAAASFALRSLVLAAVISGLILAGPVWYMLEGAQHIRGSIWGGNQVLFVSLTYDLWDAGQYMKQIPAFPPGAGQGSTVAFVGLGVLIAAGLAVVAGWRQRSVWVLAFAAVVATACSWGSAIYFSSTHADFVKWLPWQWVTNEPILDNVEAVHFAALADLGAAVVIAIGLGTVASLSLWSHLPAWIRLIPLVVVAAVLLIPQWSTYQAPLRVAEVKLPPWYATAATKVPSGSVIASYPFPASAGLEAQPMVWQVEDGMRFRLAGGYVKVPGRGNGVIGTGPVGSATWTLDALTLAWGKAGEEFNLTGLEVRNLRSALQRWGVSYIVVTDTGAAPVEAAGVFTAVMGVVPAVSHRAWVWTMPHGPLIRTPATLAATTFQSCRAFAPSLRPVPANHPLPQTVNRCIADKVGAL